MFNIKNYWDKNKKTASCVITGNNKKIIGTGEAFCHPDDIDVLSERTGSYIAELRARINFLTSLRDNKIYPAYETLKHLLSTMEMSKKYNPNSYEAKRLKKELKNYEEDYNFICEELKALRKNLNQYIVDKTKMANLYRMKTKIEEKKDK